MEVFEINGIFYNIEQDKYEPREIFMERVWYILNKIKNNDNFDNNEFEILVVESRIEINKKYLKCDY